MGPLKVRDGTDEEDREDGERDEGNEDRKAKRQLDAEDVETDEEQVGDRPPAGRKLGWGFEDRAEVAADADDDDRGGDDILHRLAEAGDKAAPGSHRGAAEAVGTAGVRQGG
jgi:hypothetical protein